MALVTRGVPCVTRYLRGLALVLAGTALACGDALVDDLYSGTPRFTVPGTVAGASEYVDTQNPEVSVALFWSLRGMMPGEEDVLVEQPGTAFRGAYYRNFQMQIFDEPGPEHLVSRPSGARVGVAWLGAYQDANSNHRRDDSEPLIGGSLGRVLIRAMEPLSAEASPTGAPLAEGWHIVSAPLACRPSGGNPDEPVPDGECGVPLGAACRQDSDCGAGMCLRELVGPWPGGACAIPEPPKDGCRQRGSVLLRAPHDPTMAAWLKPCRVTEDCGRAAPYQCDQQLRMCRPTANITVEMNDQGPPRSYCEPGPQAPGEPQP
ncbi:hypothetical protein [Pyxidicoccus caerfyrddinensis]|uniref:hypothetical protein n=1 Tax=Pyxidicoccus caerfyrddinensis TaxID=2709663 RepID=UPI0013DD7D62|nr:hypothetical protein [Pyxidicoccus caerfyrddinensis]